MARRVGKKKTSARTGRPRRGPASGHEGQMGPRPRGYAQEHCATHGDALVRAALLRRLYPGKRVYIVAMIGRWVVNLEPRRPRRRVPPSIQ